jgi:hypothetical protein
MEKATLPKPVYQLHNLTHVRQAAGSQAIRACIAAVVRHSTGHGSQAPLPRRSLPLFAAG